MTGVSEEERRRICRDMAGDSATVKAFLCNNYLGFLNIRFCAQFTPTLVYEHSCHKMVAITEEDKLYVCFFACLCVGGWVRAHVRIVDSVVDKKNGAMPSAY